MKNEVPESEVAYRFLFQIADEGLTATDEIEDRIKNIAQQFDIPEKEMNINHEYLMANYVDPVMVPAIIMIMAVVVLAGVITIYSIYYVSMNQRVQEFGRMKAIGGTKRQIRQIVLREGLCVALFTIPAGLLIGTFISWGTMKWFFRYAVSESNEQFVETAMDILDELD